MNWQDYISSDPNICHGKTCVKGTRIMVSVVLDNIAEGRSIKEILYSYPTLSEEAIKACLEYAAYIAREEMMVFSEYEV